MEAIQSPDFASVYEEHAPYVRRVLAQRGVRPVDLDDVLQDVFIVVHRQLSSFEGRSNIQTWLHSVAWRAAANYHRKHLRDEAKEAAPQAVVGAGDPASMPGPRLRALFAAIKEPNRDLLALHDIGGLTISELSELTGNARATIRQHVDRGRAALGQRIWNALTARDHDAWLEGFAPRLAEQRLELPLDRPIVRLGNAFSCVGNVVIALWRGPGSARAIEGLVPLMFAAAETHAEGFRFLSVIEEGSTPPPRDARQLNAWVAAKLGRSISAAAWVAEGSFVTTVVAPVINTSLFLAGVPLNLRFFDHLTPAASWLGEHGPQDAAAITAQVDVMRRCLLNPAGS